MEILYYAVVNVILAATLAGGTPDELPIDLSLDVDDAGTCLDCGWHEWWGQPACGCHKGTTHFIPDPAGLWLRGA